MFKLILLSSFAACVFGAAIPKGMLPQLDGRIVGGTATAISKTPYQISLQRSGAHFCGGSIVAPNKVLTAAHCVQNISPSQLRIRAGSSYWSSGGVAIKVSSITYHPNYSRSTLENDIAVLTLSTSLIYSTNIKKIALASTAPANGASAIISGWGTLASGASTISHQLQHVNVNIIGQSQCRSSTYSYGSRIKNRMICAGAIDKDACQGDSGGPLVSGGILVGVISWGNGCAASTYPGVYSNVAEFKSWIENNI